MNREILATPEKTEIFYRCKEKNFGALLANTRTFIDLGSFSVSDIQDRPPQLIYLRTQVSMAAGKSKWSMISKRAYSLEISVFWKH